MANRKLRSSLTHMEGLPLTPTQSKAISLAAIGLTNKEIAVVLKNTEQTTKNLVAEAMTRLGAKNRAHAVYLYHVKGLGHSQLSPTATLVALGAFCAGVRAMLGRD